MKKKMSYYKKENLKGLVMRDFEKLLIRVNMITDNMETADAEQFKRNVFGDIITKLGNEMKYS